MDLTSGLKRARARGASLLAVTTADQQAAARAVARLANGSAAVVGWDCVRGPHAVNGPAGQAAVDRLLDGLEPVSATVWADCALLALTGLPEGALLVAYQAHRLLDDSRNVAAIAMLRDPLAARGCTLVLLCPSWAPPPEIATDVLVLDDPLPNEAERQQLVERVIRDAQASAPDIEVPPRDVEQAVRLTRGLSPYAAEQTIALSLERTGLDQAALKSRFVAAINSTKGLRYEAETVALDAIGGLASAKQLARLIAGSRQPPDLVIVLDEVEKALAGASGPVGDSSGVSQDMLGQLLTAMEEWEADGLIALGHPGAGKSFVAKALGTEVGCPTLFWDLGGMKGSLVGSTEQATRAALRTIRALSSKPFFVATANALVSVPSALRRRFRSGVMFFDLPSEAERNAIWPLYHARYGLGPFDPASKPNDEGWSGAEIRNCCLLAQQYRINTREAGDWIVPVSRSASEEIEGLRRAASGRYLSASEPGVYRCNLPATAAAAPARKISFEPTPEER